MQPNSYSNDPNYTQSNETNPPTPPYQQGGQYVQPPYQGQQGQPPPPYQYTNQPPPVSQRAAMNQGESTKFAIGKIIDYIRWIIVALELLFLLRFALELIGADPYNPFAQFLYNFTGFFLYPFLGIVPSTRLGTHGVAVFEWSTLIGMAVYGILYWILMLFLRTTISRPQEPI